MQTVTALPSSAMPPDALREILADYVALDRVRVFRRLLVKRCGGLAALALALAVSLPGTPLAVRGIAPGVLLTPAIWAWIGELRLARRLAGRLDAVSGRVFSAVPGEPFGVPPVRKSQKVHKYDRLAAPADAARPHNEAARQIRSGTERYGGPTWA